MVAVRVISGGCEGIGGGIVLVALMRKVVGTISGLFSLAATVAAAEAARGEAASELVGDLGSFLLLGSTFLSTARHCLHYFS